MGLMGISAGSEAPSCGLILGSFLLQESPLGIFPALLIFPFRCPFLVAAVKSLLPWERLLVVYLHVFV